MMSACDRFILSLAIGYHDPTPWNGITISVLSKLDTAPMISGAEKNIKLS